MTVSLESAHFMGPQWHRTCLLLPCKSSDSAHDLACGVRRHNLGSEPEGWVKPTLASLFDLVDSVLEMVLASSRAFRSPDPSSYWMTAGAWSVLAAKATYELEAAGRSSVSPLGWSQRHLGVHSFFECMCHSVQCSPPHGFAGASHEVCAQSDCKT